MNALEVIFPLLTGVLILGVTYRMVRFFRPAHPRSHAYDLGELNRLVEGAPEAADRDRPSALELDPDDPGFPYCAWCDASYPPHTARCNSCGRAF